MMMMMMMMMISFIYQVKNIYTNVHTYMKVVIFKGQTLISHDTLFISTAMYSMTLQHNYPA